MSLQKRLTQLEKDRKAFDQKIHNAEMKYLTAPNWTLLPPQNSAVEETAHSDCIAALDAEWNAIKNDYPEFENVNVRSCIDRLSEATKFVKIAGFHFGENDSTVRQALFVRMTDFYNVEYNTIYERWLYSKTELANKLGVSIESLDSILDEHDRQI